MKLIISTDYDDCDTANAIVSENEMLAIINKLQAWGCDVSSIKVLNQPVEPTAEIATIGKHSKGCNYPETNCYCKL